MTKGKTGRCLAVWTVEEVDPRSAQTGKTGDTRVVWKSAYDLLKKVISKEWRFLFPKANWSTRWWPTWKPLQVWRLIPTACTWCLAVSALAGGYICPYRFHAEVTVPSTLLSFALGHDCSIRLWNLESKTCIQEFTAHRKKFEESIHDVAFHPSKCYIASAGADALAKVFVWWGTSASPCSSYKSTAHRETEDQGGSQLALPFCLAEGAQRTLLKYSFAVPIQFSKSKVCSGCCKLSWTCEPETFRSPQRGTFISEVVLTRWAGPSVRSPFWVSRACCNGYLEVSAGNE